MSARQRTTACTVQAPFAVVKPTSGGQTVDVELGGCNRVYVEGENFLRRLDAATIARLFGPGA
jgi:hypothetical protein